MFSFSFSLSFSRSFSFSFFDFAGLGSMAGEAGAEGRTTVAGTAGVEGRDVLRSAFAEATDLRSGSDLAGAGFAAGSDWSTGLTE